MNWKKKRKKTRLGQIGPTQSRSLGLTKSGRVNAANWVDAFSVLHLNQIVQATGSWLNWSDRLD